MRSPATIEDPPPRSPTTVAQQGGPEPHRWRRPADKDAHPLPRARHDPLALRHQVRRQHLVLPLRPPFVGRACPWSFPIGAATS